MTRILGKNIMRNPCCGAFICSQAYGSINLMAQEHWTDGRTVHGLMSQDGGIRICKCGHFYLLNECEHVMTLPKEKPRAPEGWQKSKNNWWTRFLGKPTIEEIIRQYDTRSKSEIDDEKLKFPDAVHVADASMPDVIKQSGASSQFQIAARRRYWQYLNDPYREVYRKQKELDPDSFPDYQPSPEQRENMQKLIELLQKTSNNCLQISELYREMGDFSNSLSSLSTHGVSENTLLGSIRFLSSKGVSAPARFTPNNQLNLTKKK